MDRVSLERLVLTGFHQAEVGGFGDAGAETRLLQTIARQRLMGDLGSTSVEENGRLSRSRSLLSL